MTEVIYMAIHLDQDLMMTNIWFSRKSPNKVFGTYIQTDGGMYEQGKIYTPPLSEGIKVL